MYEIIPSPGTENKDFSEFEKRIEAVRPFARTIHIDIVDGKFAPNTTFSDPKPFAKYTKDFVFEIHLMVEEPVNHLKAWAEVGFQRFIGQIEQMSDQVEFVAQAQLLGEVVLAIDGKTPLVNVTVPYEDLDGILVMTINAGFSGQKFEISHLEKVKQIRSRGITTTTGDLFPIEVDGGINDQTILEAHNAGANRFVITSFLYNFPDPKTQFEKLQALLPKS